MANTKNYGIDAISIHIPPLYLPIGELTVARGLDGGKLQFGLGLKNMAVLDADEDTATLAAEAALKLIEQNGIDPRAISRIYLGTESALDGSKPTATYVAEILQQALEAKYGERIFKNCDVLDMTFACIGGVDAMLNCVDYIRANEGKKALVIAADFAKYELASSGEYTQGAGAAAMLITENPRLATVGNSIGVGFDGVGDFFKPIHDIEISVDLRKELEKSGLKTDDKFLSVHSDEPVFDGPYSNECYKARISEAIEDFTAKTKAENLIGSWDKIVFHLPYAYQGRRMFVSEYMKFKGIEEDEKIFAKGQEYKQFVAEKIAGGEQLSSEVGNMYTASLFASLASVLDACNDKNEELAGKNIACIAYGSGSKAKVFELKINEGWKQAALNNKGSELLSRRLQINFDTYEKLHRGEQEPAVSKKRVSLSKAEENGYRTYRVI